MGLRLVPLTLPRANNAVTVWHRHHAAIPPGFPWFSIGVVNADDELVGVAIAGRPTNRNNDDRETVEVLRLATDGTRNACSMLLGACQRAAKAIGAWRCITYTLDDETGSSLRAVGWERQADNIQSFWTDAGSRTPAVDRPHMEQRKVRWAVEFADGPREFSEPVTSEPSNQGELFA